MLSRLLYGARTSLVIAGSASILAAVIGTFIGLIAGYFRGWVDAVLMRLADVQLAFPFIVLALALLAVTVHRTSWRIILVLGIADWVVYARVVRARAWEEREKDYVRAATVLGTSHWRKMTRYVLPTVLPTVIVIVLLEFAVLMLVESILSFIGLGIEPPGISWGTIIADGRENIAIAWWLLAFPVAAIFTAVLGVNLLADGLAEVLDPRLRLTARLGRASSALHRQRATGGPSAAANALAIPPRDVKPVPETEASAPRGENAVEHPSAEAVASALPRFEAEMIPASAAVVRVEDLVVAFSGSRLPAVDGVSFSLLEGERLAIVGESGSGKTVMALAIMGLLDPAARILRGSIRLAGRELIGMPARELRSLRGGAVAMIFQDPGTELNPSLRVGYQLAEAIRLHQHVTRREARARAVEALRLVRIGEPNRTVRRYPFELSGGMQQRAMIAMALSCRPSVLIADEPTTALDVTTQAQILRELDRLVTELHTGVILISHDLGVVRELTDRVVVMYRGTVCEVGAPKRSFSHPSIPIPWR